MHDTAPPTPPTRPQDGPTHGPETAQTRPPSEPFDLGALLEDLATCARLVDAYLEEHRPTLEEKLAQLRRFAAFVEETRRGTILVPASDLER